MAEEVVLKLSRTDMQAKVRVDSCLSEAKDILRSLAEDRKRQQSEGKKNIVGEIRKILQEV